MDNTEQKQEEYWQLRKKLEQNLYEKESYKLGKQEELLPIFLDILQEIELEEKTENGDIGKSIYEYVKGNCR